MHSQVSEPVSGDQTFFFLSDFPPLRQTAKTWFQNRAQRLAWLGQEAVSLEIQAFLDGATLSEFYRAKEEVPRCVPGPESLWPWPAHKSCAYE